MKYWPTRTRIERSISYESHIATRAWTVLLMASVLAGSAAASDQRADEVIARAVTAMGGLDRIHAINSLVMRGYHYEGSYRQEFSGSKTSNAVMVRMRPNLRLVGCRPEVSACGGQWGRILEGFDGSRGWELNWPKQRLVRTVNKAEQALRCGAQFDFLFIDYARRGFSAEYLGRKMMLGRDAVAVRIDQPGCSSAIYYFDPTTDQLMMQQLHIPIHARGESIDTIAIHREFTMVEGVRLPSRSEELSLKTGEVLGGGVWTSIEANILSSASVFVAPSVQPSGVTAVVLSMLDAANEANPSPMIALYERFRASDAGRDADTTYDLNWLGYELLKVDKYSCAIAVFQKVIEENPGSPDAYESLGDAYLQMGKSRDALHAFDRSLLLDPQREQTARKRNRIATASGPNQ